MTASFILSDNLLLDSAEPETGGVLRLRPFVSLNRRGSRVQARVNYGPSALWYPGNSDLNDVRHTLDAALNTELIERYFFLDFRAKANQALVNPRVNAGFGAVGNPDAFTQTASVSVTPRIILPLVRGRFATVRIQPGIGAVATASTVDNDSANTVGERDTRISIISGPQFTTIPWSVNWRRRIFDTDTDAGYGRFDTRVGYIFNRRYRTDLIVGYDDGDYVAADGTSRGARWELRFRWTPRPSSDVEVGAGQSYFGDLFRLRARHRHKRWALRADYDVEIQDARSEILEQEIVPVEDVFGQPIVDPITGEDVEDVTIQTPVLIDEIFLRDRLRLQLGYSRGRSSANLNWNWTRRDYSESDFDTQDSQVRLVLRRRLSTRLTASAGVRVWQHWESQDNAFDFWQDSLDLGLSYQLGPRTSLRTRILRQQRESDAPDGSFSENRISMSVRMRL